MILERSLRLPAAARRVPTRAPLLRRHIGKDNRKDGIMTRAATLGPAPLTPVYDRLPRYEMYRSRRRARIAERDFRVAMGRLLKRCGDHLLGVVERQPQLITSEQSAIVDHLVEEIGSILRRLNRQGEIALSANAALDLEEVDLRLLALLEQLCGLASRLTDGLAAEEWFREDAGLLWQGLNDFEAAAEERNFLLGLGWESELHGSRDGGSRGQI